MDQLHGRDEGEVLTGAKAIANRFGFTPRQIYYWVGHAGFPVFHIGKIICARPAHVRRWIAEQEAAARKAG